MKVYGDALEEVSISDLVERINERIVSMDFHDLESVRGLLIDAGQVEQTIADAEEQLASELVRQSVGLTDRAAEVFCGLYFGTASQLRLPSPIGFADDVASKRVTVKTPEGFAFYALYPEQYCASAGRWGLEQKRERTAVVVGLRSIGTTLSAVVNAALRLHGWCSTRMAVRAEGHPFNRRVELPKLPTVNWVLVVDEGPGMSGSSMAAIAAAVREQDFTSEQIVFFPAHENGPGDAASADVRIWWDSIRIVTTPLGRTNWNGRRLREQLSDASAKILPNVAVDRDVREPVLEDCSGGLWRRFAFRCETNWPAVGGQFERMKFLYRTETGAVLWKFLGLVPNLAEEAFVRMDERAKRTRSPAPLQLCNGFVAVSWIEGERLTCDCAEEMLSRLAAYIAASAQKPLAREHALAATKRLADMTVFNLREGLGDRWPRSLEKFIASFRSTFNLPTYGDGRMAPHEWVRSDGGTIFKTDVVGHDSDHTLVGRQAVYWDIAGAIFEWNMNDSQAERFARACAKAGFEIHEHELLFYQFAYGAFRVGFYRLNQTLTADWAEIARLKAAEKRYGMLLRRLIRTSFSNSVTMLSDPGLISTRDMMSSEMPRK